jgi:hypothetical protein
MYPGHLEITVATYRINVGDRESHPTVLGIVMGPDPGATTGPDAVANERAA